MRPDYANHPTGKIYITFFLRCNDTFEEKGKEIVKCEQFL